MYEGVDSLKFPIHEMVGVTAEESIVVNDCLRTNTSCVLRVVVGEKDSRRLFIKTATNDGGDNPFWRLCIREVEFYEFVNQNGLAPFLNVPVRRRHMVLPDESGYYLVLDDVSDAFCSWKEMDFGDIDVWKSVIRAVAHLHTAFRTLVPWTQLVNLSPSTEEVIVHTERLKTAFYNFRDDFSDRIAASDLSLLERSILVVEKFQKEKCTRLKTGKGATMTHGDLHTRNVMYPQGNGTLPLLVDWQFWGVNVGVLDLPHLIGTGLPENLKGCQEALVRCYYNLLGEKMTSGYSWEACWADYRQGIVNYLFMPVWQYIGFDWGHDRWKGTLKNAIENYHRLHCEELATS